MVRYYLCMRKVPSRKLVIALVVVLAAVYLIVKADQWYSRHRAQTAAEATP